ncbi:hypothetical protein ACIBQX_04515 [Nonomuraea sp. NPDC049714]|uniref:hypothetical protein n=1 Tax=Nonomuraea sp. NPDC049714 TaxID=3364357 RepID=UPI0037AA74E1
MTDRDKLDQWSYFEERDLASAFVCSWVEAPDHRAVTLRAVQGNARLASGGLAEEIVRSDRRVPDQVYPVLVGGGIPLFPR